MYALRLTQPSGQSDFTIPIFGRSPTKKSSSCWRDFPRENRSSHHNPQPEGGAAFQPSSLLVTKHVQLWCLGHLSVRWRSPQPRSAHRAATIFFLDAGAMNLSDKRCNNHRRIVAYGVLNCATSPTVIQSVPPCSARLLRHYDPVSPASCPRPCGQRTSIRDYH